METNITRIKYPSWIFSKPLIFFVTSSQWLLFWPRSNIFCLNTCPFAHIAWLLEHLVDPICQLLIFLDNGVCQKHPPTPCHTVTQHLYRSQLKTRNRKKTSRTVFQLCLGDLRKGDGDNKLKCINTWNTKRSKWEEHPLNRGPVLDNEDDDDGDDGGEDDGDHNDEHLLSTYSVLVSPTRSHRSQLSFLDHHLSWEPHHLDSDDGALLLTTYLLF